MIRRSYIPDGSGGQIHLTEMGQDQRVLLIHQTPRSWDEFREVMTILAPRAHLIAVDLPGMGASSAPAGDATIEAYAAAAARAIEHVGGGPMAVCGHHTGGVVAIELAASRPELLTSLILSSTPWIDADARAARASRTPIDTVARSHPNRAQELYQHRAPYYPSHGGYLDRFVCDALRADDPAAGHRAVGRYHMERAVPRIGCPILLVEHRKDPFASAGHAGIANAFPSARSEQIAEGRIPLEATAQQFADILRRWLDEDVARGIGSRGQAVIA